MANYRFRGLDHRAATTGEVPIALDGVDPPLGLAQLLVLRRRACELLRSDGRFASATVIHTYLQADGPPVRVNATVHRAYLNATANPGTARAAR